MSLELISNLKIKLSKKIIDKIVHELDICGYKNVRYDYVDYGSNYGFIRKGENYQKNEMPLFDLVIKDFRVSLAFNGNYNELAKIKVDVENCFDKVGIFILLEEE